VTMDSFEIVSSKRDAAEPIASSLETLACLETKAYLSLSEREKLRRSIEGTVASMTAESLAGRFHVGLEQDRLYEQPLARFRELILAPATRLATLRQFIETELPAGKPDFFKVLFIETVARQLGREWVDDSCDFLDVTIGTARLQELVLALAQDYHHAKHTKGTPLAVVMMPYGEQHTLMPTLLGLLFDTLGWSRQVLAPDTRFGPAFVEAVTHADVACIGWSNSRLVGEFCLLIDRIRSLRTKKRLPLIVGGAAALEAVDFLVDMGIDCICDSVYSAARICQNFYELEKLTSQAQRSRRTAVLKTNGLDWLSS